MQLVYNRGIDRNNFSYTIDPNLTHPKDRVPITWAVF